MNIHEILGAGMGVLVNEKNRFNLLIQIGSALRQLPEIPLAEALSAGQVESKRWLIEELERLDLPLGIVFVLGGWWGLLPAMMLESRIRLEKIRSLDIDPGCAPVADALNRRYVRDNWKFKASTQDMLTINYAGHAYRTIRADGSVAELTETPDTIINTSCEHIRAFKEWWNLVPKGKLVALQSNNFREHPDHCNCSESVEQFAASAPMEKILFRGELGLPDYKRFMLIGIK